LKKKALQQAYDLAIKRKMVRREGGRWRDKGLARLVCCARLGAASDPLLLLACSFEVLQEEEAGARMGGRGLEEIAAEPMGRPEDSGGLPRLPRMPLLLLLLLWSPSVRLQLMLTGCF
jgi:hypothetical protein